MEYIRGSGAPECIFHNKHKTLYNLFSPDPAVACVGFTSWNVHIMYHFVAFCLGVFHFFLSRGWVHMGQMDFISSIFLDLIFKIIWEALHWSHFTDIEADQFPLFVHSTLILKQWRHSDQHLYLYSCAVGHAVFIKKHFGTSSVISGQAAMYMCSLVSVFCGRLFLWNS